MPTLAERIGKLDERITRLENKCNDYQNSNNETKVDLGKAITEMKNLIKTVDELPSNLEKTMLKTIEIQAKEHQLIYNKIENIRNEQEETNKKVEKLQQKLDERTVEKSSSAWDKLIWLVIGGVVGFLFFLLERVIK